MNKNKTTTKCAIYARVSTSEQDVKKQVQELKKYIFEQNYNLQKVYIDEISGTKSSRPSLDLMLQDMRQGNFNCILIYKLDRLGRSLQHLITILEELHKKNIDLIVSSMNIDTKTASGKLLFNIMGAVAEFERDIIRERVIAGLDNARRKGKRLGRPPIPWTVYNKAKRLREQGLSFRKIGKKLGVDEATIRKRMNRESQAL